MINWFLSLEKRTKIYVIVGVILVLIILYFGSRTIYWKYQYMKGIETENKELTKANKQLKKEYDAISFERAMLKTKTDKLISELEEARKKPKKLKDEVVKIPDVVRVYPDRKLDCLLTNYRHIPRSEN